MEILFEEDYIIDVSYDFSPMRKNTFSEKKIVELEGRELNDAIQKKTNKLGLSFVRATLSKKERFVEQTFTYKTLFYKGQKFEMHPGINLIVGDNGCGKSTLMSLFIKRNKKQLKNKKIIHVDMEKSNPTISTPNPESGICYTPHEIANQFMWSSESHGETREGVLKSILTMEFDLLILDEPEQGLSLKNQNKYLKELANLKKDIIIITHSKLFIENTLEVFDAEVMKWVSSKYYLLTI